MIDRIKQYIDYKGITMYSLEKAVGLNIGTFSRAVRNGTTVNSDKIELIAKHYPDLNPVWLLTGEGNMLRYASEEQTAPPPSTAPKTRAATSELEQLRNEVAKLNREIGKQEGLLEASQAQLEETKSKLAERDKEVGELHKELGDHKALLAEVLTELKQYQSVDRYIKNVAS